MKQLVVMVVVISCFARSSRAQQPNMAEVQAKMQKAQHILDSIKKAHPEMQQALDKANSAQPGLALPGLPDLNKVSQSVQEGAARVKNMQAATGAQKQQLQKGLPQPDPNSHFTTVPNADSTAIVGIIHSILTPATEKLKMIDPLVIPALDALAKDSTITPNAQGMLLLSEKYPKYMAQYLICKGVLLNPQNPWAINDLGILLRNDHRNKEAAQCFRYAYRFNDAFLIIKCNLAWAVAYYGDLMQAKNYFREILTVLPDYSSAWEGLGMIAYQQGDTKGLFEALAHQVKYIGGNGGGGGNSNGPSDNFTGFVDAVEQQQQMADLGKKDNPDPTGDHTFDNDNDDSPGTDYDVVGYTEAPHYPSYSGMFAKNIGDLFPLLGKTAGFRTMILQQDEMARNYVQAKKNSISPLARASYQDNDGAVVTPANYQKYWWLYNDVAVEYDKRVTWVTAQFGAAWDKLYQSIVTQHQQDAENYTREISAVRCPPGSGDCCPACNAVKCKWKVKLTANLQSDLGGISSLWTNYFQRLQQQIAWYVNASNPFIRRMIRSDWNELMNATREYDVRHTILMFYLRWLEMQSLIGTKQLIDAMFGNVVCTIQPRTMGDDGPDIKTTKLRKLKTFPDYCDRKDPENSQSFSYGIVNYESNCDHTRLAVNVLHLGKSGKIDESGNAGGLKGGASLGAGGKLDLGMVFEHVRSKKFKEDDYYNVGTTIALGVEG